MKVNNTRFKRFGDLERGTFFRRNYASQVYIKTCNIFDQECYGPLNSLELTRNRYDNIDIEELIEPLDCELTIK